ncbi:hypothetical protein F4782DRAFT_549242 [Xylaria castorea]|nr:hypothetical protein F4782DRAFT_549242 [Xylaria castorea]
MSLAFRSLKTPSAPQLRQLAPPLHLVHDNTQHELCIILVSDLSTKTPRSSLDTFWTSVQHVLRLDDSSPLVLGFEYSLSNGSDCVWKLLTPEAENLIECIINWQKASDLRNTALLFVCKGLGGQIVKQALINVHERCAPENRRRICELYRGAVFFGTPHPTYSRRSDWFKLTHILGTVLKLSHIQRSQAELETAIIATISKRFETCVTDTPVISIYENRVSKIRIGLWEYEKFVLVDKGLAETGVPFEKLIEADADHYGISHCPPDSPMFVSIRELLQRILATVKVAPHASSKELPSRPAIDDAIDDDDWLSVYQPKQTPDEQVESDEVGFNSSTHSAVEIFTLVECSIKEKSLQMPYRMLKPALRNPSFFGRKDILDQIDKALIFPQDDSEEKYSGLQLTFAICGLGGVGKTEIAREYAFSRQDFFDAVFWIDAEQPTQLSEGFATIATQLGFSDSADKDRVVSRNIALEWLSNPLKRSGSGGLSVESINSTERDEANWLLVFNNADDLALLQTFWPLGQRGSILITSRDPMAKRGRPGVDLKPFKQKEAAALLRKLTNATEIPENKKALISLSERLGGLPLAITQVAALIDRWEMTLSEFLRYLDKQPSIKTVAKSKPPTLQDHYNHSLFTVWALESLNPSALATLRVLSFLNPDSIRESLLLQTTPSDLLPHYPTSEELFITARLDLTKTSLVRRDRVESQMTVHRLVQDVVRAQMSPDSIMRTISFTAGLVLQAWPTSFLRFDHDTSTWNQSEELLPHILKLKKFFEESVLIMRSHSSKENFTKLLLFAGWYLLERSDFYAAKPLFETVLRISDEPGSDLSEIRADVLFALSALSAVVNEDKTKMLEYAYRHLDYRKKSRDGTQFREDRLAMAYGEVAHAELLVGHYKETIDNSRMAISLTETSPAFLSGDDWPTFSSSHQAFALAALGRHDEAVDLMQKSINYWMSRSHENHSFQ